MARTTGGPDRDVRDEVPVHHVDVNEIGAAALDGGDVAAERRQSRPTGSTARSERPRSRRSVGHRLTSREIGSPRPTLEAARGLLPDDGARRDARIWLRPDDRHAEAARAQRFGGALAVHADQVGHHVGRRLLRRD